MRAGALDERIEIKQFTLAANSRGEPIKTPSTLVSNLPAHVRRISGREFFGADQITAEIRVVFIIRWRSDVTRQMQVIFEGDTYDIRDARQIDRRHWLELHTIAQGV